MCTYEDAAYHVSTIDEDGKVVDELIYQYNNNRPEDVQVVIKNGIQANKSYTVIIEVQTWINTNFAEVKFNFSKLIYRISL